MTTDLVTEETESASGLQTRLECDARLGRDLPASSRQKALSPAGTGPVPHRIAQLAELTRLPFLGVDAGTGTVLAKSHPECIEVLPSAVVDRLADMAELCTIETASGLVFGVLPLPTIDGAKTVAVTYVLSQPDLRPHEVVLMAAERDWSEAKLDEWLSAQHHGDAALVRSVLSLALGQVEQTDLETSLLVEVEQLSEQIEQTYEEITLLHTLATNLQISRSPVELAQVCLNRLHGLTGAGANAIWLEEKTGSPTLLAEGDLPCDKLGLSRLISRFDRHEWSRPLVKNHLSGTALGAEFPGLENLVIVPIAEGNHRQGWIVSCNLSGGREFSTVEASLLNSVATILGTHVRNIDLYRQHDELLLSFVRSLAQTLEARDPYTRGHSDRVALIARRLAEELSVSEEDLYNIYLAGLLHDIGKIGVDDQVLRKDGKLTADEYAQIRKHPTIGYEILSGLKNLHKILPGVRNHHETYHGKGYPDGLRGEEIPLMARVLAVADSFDAMHSDRPYRAGLSPENIEEILRRGAGNQWDPRVVDAYFASRDDIRRICEEYSPDNGDLLEGMPADTLWL